jgi:hypothetical protein
MWMQVHLHVLFGRLQVGEPVVWLATAISALRAELAEVTSTGGDPRMQLRMDPIELTVQAVLTKDDNGEIRWAVLTADGPQRPAHTLTVRLTPMCTTAEGSPTRDGATASAGLTRGTVRPQSSPATAQEIAGSQSPRDAGSLNNLGLLLATQWQPPDLSSARSWLEKAAEAGHTEAMNSLANLLANLWQPRDLSGAHAWYERAAQAGNTEAMNKLGLLLATRWQPPDLPGARTWWEKAAEAGHAEAMYNLANLLASLGEPRILPNARAWWEKAAEAGHAEAMYNLGVLLATQWEPRDLPSARAWWDKAAKARSLRSHIA